MTDPIHYPRGTKQQPLNIYTWDDQDSQQMQEFRDPLTKSKLAQFSAKQGETLGHRYASDILGYTLELSDDEKGISQGHDGVYRDPKTNEIVVVEFKGQESEKSLKQQDPKWSLDVCEDILSGRSPYGKASEQEKAIARTILKAYERGDRIRYEIVRTTVENGKMQTQLEEQTYLERPMDGKQMESPKMASIRNLTEKVLKYRGWAKGEGVRVFEGKDYVIKKEGNTLTIETNDGRGVLLKLDGRDLQIDRLSKNDMARFQSVEKSLETPKLSQGQEISGMNLGKF
ncbi:MAG: hypothetical protein WCO45_11280 [Pseudanabaena sp. ELA607]|jgi:hypothetical protein